MKILHPTISILNEDFKYTPSHLTDIRKRFRAERKKLVKVSEAKKRASVKRRVK